MSNLPSVFKAPAPNALRVVSINVNGIRAAVKKGLFDWIQSSHAHIICMQETRISADLWTDNFNIDGYTAHLFAAKKAGYAGTAIYSRVPVLAVTRGLGFDLCDDEGRYICARIEWQGAPLDIASLYLPSGSSGEAAQMRKDLFLNEFLPILAERIHSPTPLIVCGDYNIIHQKIDIKNWSQNQKSSGCLPHERAWLDAVYGLGYVDAFRTLRDDAVYSWWSNRGQARANNVGWRIDYHVATPTPRAVFADIYRDTFFSDHAPVVIDYVFDDECK